VLVTRPHEQSASFAAALAAAGATPMVYPTITLAPPPSWQPLDDALARLTTYGWAIFTSPSAVAFTLDRHAARAGAGAGDQNGAVRTDRGFAGLRIAAVGDQTARALRQRGLSVDLVPAPDQQRQEGLVEGLIEMIGAAQTAAQRAGAPPRILFPQALGGRELLREQLIAAGYAVDVVAVSQTCACDLRDPPPAFDVATFASPSALRAFVEGLGRDPLARVYVAVIGPTTAEAAAALGVRVDVMPPTPSVAALVEALIDLRRRLPRDPAPSP
jgi:uroporphyrinogen III methyltransferase / synthase